MHKVIFYPVGNGDTSQILLENGKRILFDFRHLKKTENGEGPEINLAAELRADLKEAKRDNFDVVAFTHGDADHIENSTEFFWLDHAEKYQGKDRIRIKTLWVPAAMITQTANNDGQSAETVIWRQEARHRLKAGKGIRVFSKPESLKGWLEANNLTVESRRHLITDAGQVAPDFALGDDGVEFFCHSPFVEHTPDGDVERNDCSLIFNVRFGIGGQTYDYFSVGDSTWAILEQIVKTTQFHKNDDRLAWDLFGVPHHCSYKALSDEKGVTETVPKPKVKELLLSGKAGSYIVSSSDPIESSSEGRAQVQPPHVQAQACYKSHLRQVEGSKMYVTMEMPNETKPKPLVFEIGAGGVTLQRTTALGVPFLTAAAAPRAGHSAD